MDANQQTYHDPKIVRYYEQLSSLQAAEITILAKLRDRAYLFKMLDLGVGAGRTTPYFAPQVADYLGVDYSAAMISTCQQRYPDYTFQMADVRDLSQFSDNLFDFILFSFNGLDYIEHRDRAQALSEIYRVSKPDAYFCFSTHNLQGIELQFDWRKQLSWNPLSSYVNLVMWLFLRIKNRAIAPQKLKDLDYAIIYDEPHNFRLANYYIRPRSQYEQLQPWFKNIQCFSWQTGQEISSSELEQNRELWLYYLCQVRKD
jgi:ubiquinone/menaquinone biosynthesis C-methylase UbiE